MASGDRLRVFKATDAIQPSTNYATHDMRNNHPVLDFDTTTEESVAFEDVLFGYAGGGLTVTVQCFASTAITGGVVLGGSLERIIVNDLDIDADSFATEQLSGTIAANTTAAGKLFSGTIAFTNGANMDSLADGESYRLKLVRKVGAAGDDMAGDLEVYRVIIAET